MNILLLTPGTGHFYCGSCLRDNELARALRRLGHEVVVAPLYLPLVLEEPTEFEGQQVRMGGINMYLQQKTRFAQHLPRWFANLLDRPGLLRLVARRAKLTEAPDLGAMTVSMLEGEHGHQSKEVDKLVDWVAGRDTPDVVVLSNVLLVGIVRRLKQTLDRPVVATLQGEAPFLDALPQPFSDRAWELLAERAADLDAFVPVSHSYGDVMRTRLDLDADRVHVVHNGINLTDLSAAPEPLAKRAPKTIGFLARLCRDKGLHTLIDAFVILKERGRIEGLRLHAAGAMLNEDRPLVVGLHARLRTLGLGDDVEFSPNISRDDKLALLRSLRVLSVPATYGESFGLYLLEAMAAGVPVVQPRHAAFPELLDATGGGILCEPDDPTSLANSLEELLLDEARSQELASRGRRSVTERFTSDRMAREFEAVCMLLTRAQDERA